MKGKMMKHKGGSSYTKQFESINPCKQNGGADTIPTCTNSTTTPHHPGQPQGLAISVDNPILQHVMSTPFDGNKFGSAVTTVQNPATCHYAGPGALQQVGAAKKKVTPKKEKSNS